MVNFFTQHASLARKKQTRRSIGSGLSQSRPAALAKDAPAGRCPCSDPSQVVSPENEAEESRPTETESRSVAQDQPVCVTCCLVCVPKAFPTLRSLLPSGAYLLKRRPVEHRPRPRVSTWGRAASFAAAPRKKPLESGRPPEGTDAALTPLLKVLQKRCSFCWGRGWPNLPTAAQPSCLRATKRKSSGSPRYPMVAGRSGALRGGPATAVAGQRLRGGSGACSGAPGGSGGSEGSES